MPLKYASVQSLVAVWDAPGLSTLVPLILFFSLTTTMYNVKGSMITITTSLLVELILRFMNISFVSFEI